MSLQWNGAFAARTMVAVAALPTCTGVGAWIDTLKCSAPTDVPRTMCCFGGGGGALATGAADAGCAAVGAASLLAAAFAWAGSGAAFGAACGCGATGADAAESTAVALADGVALADAAAASNAGGSGATAEAGSLALDADDFLPQPAKIESARKAPPAALESRITVFVPGAASAGQCPSRSSNIVAEIFAISRV